jgi:hypothetical protein
MNGRKLPIETMIDINDKTAVNDIASLVEICTLSTILDLLFAVFETVRFAGWSRF